MDVGMDVNLRQHNNVDFDRALDVDEQEQHDIDRNRELDRSCYWRTISQRLASAYSLPRTVGLIAAY